MVFWVAHQDRRRAICLQLGLNKFASVDWLGR